MILLDLFAGIGGFYLAAKMAGMEFEQTFYSEINEHSIKIYKKEFPTSIALGDITKINGDDLPRGEWFITGGFPCQPFSIAGNQLGVHDERYLWEEVTRLVSELKPVWCVFENVPQIANIPFSVSELEMVSRQRYQDTEKDYFKGIYSFKETLQLGVCCEDLKKQGYEVAVFEIPALAKNAPHRRMRTWIVANFDGNRTDSRFRSVPKTNGEISKWHENSKFSNAVTERDSSNFESTGREGGELGQGQIESWRSDKWHKWLKAATEFCGVDDGLSSGLDVPRLRNDISRLYPKATEKDIERAIGKLVTKYRRERIEALGNAIVPQVAMEFFRLIKEIETSQINKWLAEGESNTPT